MRLDSADAKFMRRCLLLAQKGEGKVSPNPLVGAVLVKNGKIIGEGFHEKFGAPHAETNAIADAKRRGHNMSGSTLYVSLEPCSHSGKGKKTPPCVPLIINFGIKRVVIAAKDPNPKVSGIEELKAAGIRVDIGLLENEAKEQNEIFFKFMKTGKPFVLLKMAQSANGKIGIRGKSNVRISGRKVNRQVQQLRNRFDSILVGINTVLADNPRLTCRLPGGRNPARIVLDSNLRIPLTANVLKNARKEKVIIATSEKRGREKQKQLEKLGAKVIVCGKNRAELQRLLASLPSYGIISVLIEGGAAVARAAMEERLADMACIAVSKKKKILLPNAVGSPFSQAMLRSFVQKKDFGSDFLYQKRFFKL
ncbi:MAG: bifunctional diaminohydroxyphosphoribosylaminopyrimidine deaminase/5-amino-6-(5-phosphoribosylamino)uracil reductase RibD [Candidatus Anstonellaceae archaeon]